MGYMRNKTRDIRIKSPLSSEVLANDRISLLHGGWRVSFTCVMESPKRMICDSCSIFVVLSLKNLGRHSRHGQTRHRPTGPERVQPSPDVQRFNAQGMLASHTVKYNPTLLLLNILQVGYNNIKCHT
jgi:hypothetical protein